MGEPRAIRRRVNPDNDEVGTLGTIYGFDRSDWMTECGAATLVGVMLPSDVPKRCSTAIT